ncbi:hypothetical protein BCR43DRAFT_485663 [Syncephalastrum racemosum]|uniref:Uncharacterized protein n=1 Tax=Syncephalastrum racemosum TaxID=13706 RepID=A0A1X2HMX5_SYNRA|nr:hypothetical protein BCR43DRAFT_485663 [Syncephalastrum racemosum]
MARICTDKLSRFNAVVDPSMVDWQKESDITWLYGPLYVDETQQQHTPPSMSTSSSTTSTSSSSSSQQQNVSHPATSSSSKSASASFTTTTRPGLKPVLKKTDSSTDVLQHAALRRRPDLFLPLTDIVQRFEIDSDKLRQRSNSGSGSSDSSNHPLTPGGSVRFNPEIVKVQYLPETPVRESLSRDNPYWAYEDDFSDDEDDDEDDYVWTALIEMSQFLKSTAFICLLEIAHYMRQPFRKPALPRSQEQAEHQQQNQQTQQRRLPRHYHYKTGGALIPKPLSMAAAAATVVKSVASVLSTWLLYQGLGQITWLVRRTLRIQRRQETTSGPLPDERPAVGGTSAQLAHTGTTSTSATTTHTNSTRRRRRAAMLERAASA